MSGTLINLNQMDASDSDNDDDSLEPLESLLRQLPNRRKHVTRLHLYFAVLIAAVLSCVIGFLLGYTSLVIFPHLNTCIMGYECKYPGQSLMNLKTTLSHSSLVPLIISNLTNIVKNNAKNGDEKVVEYILQQWKGGDLDEASSVQYDVLLSFPNNSKPNIFQIFDSNLQIKYISTGYLQDNDRSLPSYFAYSPQADVSGPIVFVNKGSAKDFKYVIEKGFHIKGSVLLIRSVYEPAVIERAHQHGAVGILVYFDPSDFSNDHVLSKISQQFPTGTLLPSRGDPLTPSIPSKNWAYRINSSSAYLPPIPVQPISGQDATHIFGFLDGESAPQQWTGGLEVDYKLGVRDTASLGIRLLVSNILKPGTINNAIGVIRGNVEPDRYILVGSPRLVSTDGIEGYVGTAALLGLSHTFAELRRSKGWRPGRSIMFCSWGGHEFGDMGITEWMEENREVLHDRGVAYISIDTEDIGNEVFYPSGSPLLYGAIVNAAKSVEDPFKANKTLFDSWKQSYPGTADMARLLAPRFQTSLGVLLGNVGISGASLQLFHHELPGKTGKESMISSISPLVEVAAYLAHGLSESMVLSLDARPYALFMKERVKYLEEIFSGIINTYRIDLSFFKSAVSNFSETVEKFHKTNLEGPHKYNFEISRRINDQLMAVERAFVLRETEYGFPNKLPFSSFKHLAFGEDCSEVSTSLPFGYLVDILSELQSGTSGNTANEVHQYISKMVHAIRTATSALNIDLIDDMS